MAILTFALTILKWLGGFFAGVMDWLHRRIPADIWRALAVLLLGSVLGWQGCYIFYKVPVLKQDQSELKTIRAAQERATEDAAEDRANAKKRAVLADAENQQRRDDRQAESRKIMESVNDAPETGSLHGNPALRAYADGLRKRAAGNGGTSEHGVSPRTCASR